MPWIFKLRNDRQKIEVKKFTFKHFFHFLLNSKEPFIFHQPFLFDPNAVGILDFKWTLIIQNWLFPNIFHHLNSSEKHNEKFRIFPRKFKSTFKKRKNEASDRDFNKPFLRNELTKIFWNFLTMTYMYLTEFIIFRIKQRKGN